MCVLFGTYHFDGSAADADLHRVSSAWNGRAPDGESVFCEREVAVLHRACCTTKESRFEIQPQISQSGAILAWDGRLDNRDQLVSQLPSATLSGADDLSIVRAAYERWGVGCFPKLLGDWAMAISDRKDHSLLLAKDFIGARLLFYTIGRGCVAWSTLLDALVSFAGRSFDLQGEFIAGLLAFFPATHLTPYAGIHSVPPACFVRITHGRQCTTRYWDFDPAKQLRYRTDADFEEHFRVAFRESIRRRLRADAPVLAELSGGIDSSAIVCVADSILRDGLAEAPRLDTVSYYDDSEPDWDERPYFTQVESLRGRTGWHINVAIESTNACSDPDSRVLLSGTGGDEVTGGIPDPAPELADLLVRACFGTFARQARAWALNRKRPWVHLLWDAVRAYLLPACFEVPERLRPAPWLDPAFRTNYSHALRGYPRRLGLLLPLPSFQENMSTLEMLRRQLGASSSAQQVSRERRYPFLDRDLLEFLFAIPREQVLRPGHRRSLMRRALKGIVPDEILNRRRKAFVSRRPIVEIAKHWAGLAETARSMHCLSLGIIDERSFREEVLRAGNGQSTHAVTLLRLFSVEAWLKQMMASGVWSGSLARPC
jgi:asparagine synthase (glutamine-hydrolysing)